MACRCKGICHRYKGRRRYHDPPNRKCRKCDVHIDAEKWQGKYCPCCGQLLSTIPTHTSNRRKLLQVRGIKRIA